MFKHRSTTVEKMASRLVYSTKNPHVFEVIGSDGVTRYPITVVEGFFHPDPQPYLQCGCEWGVHAQLVPASTVLEVGCWHAKLVIVRRLRGSLPGGSNGRRAERKSA